MTALEEQLTRALRRLSAQYETEQRRHSGQVEALRQHVEALRGRVERQDGENEALRRRVERLSEENEVCSGESSGSTCWRHAWPSISGHPPSRDRAASVSDAPFGTGSRSGSEPLTMASSRHPNAATPSAPPTTRLAEKPSRREVSTAQIVQSIFERNRTMARTKRSRRSYSAGEWGRNRVRVFPDRENQHPPNRVARGRAQAEPVVEAPRLGLREDGRPTEFAAGLRQVGS